MAMSRRQIVNAKYFWRVAANDRPITASKILFTGWTPAWTAVISVWHRLTSQG